MQGYSVGQKIIDKTGMRASNTAELVFEDCIVPASNLVGEVGDSMIHMMRNLEIERVALAAMSLGIARRCLFEMNRYATEREAFGRQIRDFGQMQRYIGESWAKYRAMRSYIYDTANNLGLGKAGQRLIVMVSNYLQQLRQKKSLMLLYKLWVVMAMWLNMLLNGYGEIQNYWKLEVEP